MLYFAIVVLALLYFAGGVGGEPARGIAIIAFWVSLLYAAPYFASFSHPTYRFPLLPVIALFAVAALARGSFTVAGVMRVFDALTRRRKALFTASLLLFAAIQVEWTVMMIGRL